jgi:hypothetical protein
VNNWSSNNNAVFANKGQALDDVTVSLAVTQDLVTENNAGFTLQLNCTPMPGCPSWGFHSLAPVRHLHRQL